MDIGDLFKSFFGLRGRGRKDFPFNDFEEECDCQESDEFTKGDKEFPFFFGHESSSLDDMFHHFNSDIHYKQMESLRREMEDMLKSFGTITSEHFPPHERPGILDQPKSDPPGGSHTWIFSIPQPGNEKESPNSNPRDFLLKEDDTKKPAESSPSLPGSSQRDSKVFQFPFKNPFRSPSWHPPSLDQRKDTDLDGKLSSDQTIDLIKKRDSERQMERPVQPHKGFFSGQSVSVSTVRGPDGKMEHKRIVRDSSGRKESTVSRSVDGQTHTVTTIKEPDGKEQRHEDFKNMDENDINKFEKKWNTQLPPQDSKPQPHSSSPATVLRPDDLDLYSKFFKNPWK